jgi:lysine 2,3-aminomutase
MKPANISNEQWFGYKWQLQNAIHTAEGLQKTFPNISASKLSAIATYSERYRFQLTPYLVSCLQLDESGNPLSSDPLVGLFLPDPDVLLQKSDSSYESGLMNWEMPGELVVPGSSAFHWKYTDRIMYRSPGCMAICSYCLEVHRTVDRKTTKKVNATDWELGMNFLRSHPEIREFVFSGGDPLLMPDELLGQRLADLRSIPHIETIRLNSAVLMHCPMRITEKLVGLFKRYNITELGVHVVHPRQITEEFQEALSKFDEYGYGSIIKLAQIPLLRDVNDDTETMRKLLCGLEQCRVKGYYLLHDMPWTLGATKFRTTVYRGVEIMKPLYRHLSHVAWLEYIIVGRGGKATVPLERNDFWLSKDQVNYSVWAIDGTEQSLRNFAFERKDDLYKFSGTPEFIYSTYLGKPVVVFLNWKNRWEMYLDQR